MDASTAKIGRWWFQRRSLTPLPLFLIMVVLPPEFKLQGMPLAWAILGILGTEALRIWAVGYAGSATRTRGDTVPALVHAGPFRYVRNPLYIANTAMYTLAGVLFGFSWLSLIVLAFSLLQYTFIIAFEEETLHRTFGSAYAEYCEAVPRWLPRFSPYRSSAHVFSLSRALRSEKSTFYSMLLMAVLYVVKERIRAGN